MSTLGSSSLSVHSMELRNTEETMLNEWYREERGLWKIALGCSATANAFGKLGRNKLTEIEQ